MKTKELFLTMVLMILLIACTEEKAYKIGVSQCGAGEWRDKVNNEMLAAQHLYEHDVKISVACAYDNSQRQIEQIDSLVESGVDLLVVAPNEAAAIGEAISRAKKKGIPVVLFDRKAETEDYVAFIGGSNVEAGRAAGNYALELAHSIQGHKPVILEITAGTTTSPALDRHKGFAAALQGHDEVDYVSVDGDWSPDVSCEIVRQQIAQGRKPDVVFCHSDLTAMGAAEAACDISIIGIDGMLGPNGGIEAVRQGLLAGSYIYPTHGEQVVRLALDILTGKPYERENILQSVMVTPDNADMIAMSNSELMKQTESLVVIQNKLEDYFGLANVQSKIIIIGAIAIVLLIVAIILIWRAISQIRQAHRRQKALNEEQTLFYTNASHQLKTPLTLIAGPVKKLMEKKVLKGDDQALLEIVGRNINQLEIQVSSVLNFRKAMNATVVSDKTASEAMQQALSSDIIKDGHLNMLNQDDTDELLNILIVDDNDDMRRYLRTLLADKFYVLEASDGQSGLQLARESVPDIIVSDVMMPIMDGLQFCKKVKEDFITSHIPVILLTARDAESQQMEGYESGADAYLTKPFSADLLIVRIYNLLKSRQQLRQITDDKIVTDQQAKLTTQDKLFIDRLKEAITGNMQNPDLKMDDIGEELGISRVQLYRKVKTLTGLSPVELLRQMRLQRGMTLLNTTTKTVAEIAYEVGFSSSSYFSNCFKKQYGKQPLEARAK